MRLAERQRDKQPKEEQGRSVLQCRTTGVPTLEEETIVPNAADKKHNDTKIGLLSPSLSKPLDSEVF